MYIFFIAILISVVIRYLSGKVIKFYISLEKTDDELGKSFIFNVAIVLYVINTGLLYINSAILAALAIKTYLL